MNNFKEIHIGKIIKQLIDEKSIEISRICKFMSASETEIEKMYQSKSLDAEILLRYSKLLEYDFFRIYSQHLILYAPPGAAKKDSSKIYKESKLPTFRKQIYTKEIIDFVLDIISTNQKTKQQVIEEYGIPKTTLYK